MALLKNKTTDFGVEANYWKVSMVSIDRNLKEASFSLNLYKQRGDDLFFETYTVTDLMGIEDKTNYEKYFESTEYTDIYNACYNYAKNEIEFFKDAVSDI